MSKEDIIPHQFEPGQSGNPNGRPIGRKSITAMLQELMSKEITIKDLNGVKHRTSVAGAISVKLAHMALNGDVRAAKEILDRTDGKVLELFSSAVETIDMTPESMTFDEAYRLKYGKKPKRRKKRGSSKD